MKRESYDNGEGSFFRLTEERSNEISETLRRLADFHVSRMKELGEIPTTTDELHEYRAQLSSVDSAEVDLQDLKYLEFSNSLKLRFPRLYFR